MKFIKNILFKKSEGLDKKTEVAAAISDADDLKHIALNDSDYISLNDLGHNWNNF